MRAEYWSSSFFDYLVDHLKRTRSSFNGNIEFIIRPKEFFLTGSTRALPDREVPGVQ